MQTGGRNIAAATASALNEFSGRALHRRDWGRALEKLKKANNLRNDTHGKILSNGDYIDGTGCVIDNILDYIP